MVNKLAICTSFALDPFSDQRPRGMRHAVRRQTRSPRMVDALLFAYAGVRTARWVEPLRFHLTDDLAHRARVAEDGVAQQGQRVVGQFGVVAGGDYVTVGGNHVDQLVERIDLIQGHAEEVAASRVAGHRLCGFRRRAGRRRCVAFGAVGRKREVVQHEAYLLRQQFQTDRHFTHIDLGDPFLRHVRRARFRLPPYPQV